MEYLELEDGKCVEITNARAYVYHWLKSNDLDSVMKRYENINDVLKILEYCSETRPPKIDYADKYLRILLKLI